MNINSLSLFLVFLVLILILLLFSFFGSLKITSLLCSWFSLNFDIEVFYEICDEFI